MQPNEAQADNRLNLVELLAKELNKGKLVLPGFPDILMRVRKALADPNCNVNTITKIVTAEPLLTARILRISNSAALRAAAGEIKDPRNAVARLGFTLVQSATVTFAAEQMKIAHRYEKSKHRFQTVWDRSIHVAAIAYVLAKRFTKLNPDEALLTGLMHAIGKVYILARAEDYPELFEDDAELESVLASWYVPIGEAVLQGWDFPDEITAAVAAQLDAEREVEEQMDLADVLIVALPLPPLLGSDDDVALSLQATRAELRLGLSAQLCTEVLAEAAEQIEDLRQTLGH